MSDNPLLTPSTHPNFAPPFADIKSEHYLPAVEATIEEAKANIAAIKENAEPANFENTIVALEVSAEALGDVTGVFYNQLSCMGGDELHALAEKIGPLTAAYGSDVSLDADLFARIKAVYDGRETAELNAEQMKLLEDTYDSFVRSGALLDDAKKGRLREISQETSVLGPSFMNNVSKSSESFEMVIEDEADLSGLPENAVEAAKMAASEKAKDDKSYEGKWLFTLDYPSFGPFIQYGDNRELREKIWRAFASRSQNVDGDAQFDKAAYDNSENIRNIVALRDEKAKLMGCANVAEFILERRMAKTPKAVFDFLDKLKTAYKPAALKELEELKDFAKSIGGPDELKPWDVSYYSEKLKEKKFDFSSEDLRPYFPLDQVLDGCFTHFSKLFGLKFVANDKYPLWHEDVKSFDVFNESDNSFVGTLYGDFFPRTGKKNGAWMTAYRGQGLYKGKVERPVIAIVCNFTKPTADKPSLISHNELTTLFHEMGHAIHGMVSDVTYRSLAGTNVLWDFVELPSQVQENWCYEKETLDLFAKHYETGESIPDELVSKLVAAKNYHAAMAGLRQVSLGTLDMTWHTCDPSTIGDVAAFEDAAVDGLMLFPRLAGASSPSFSHIFAGGYAAGYYSYKWAEVLDADTFELFLECGLYDSETAHRYKDEVLARGGSDEPDVLYRNFRGRDADPDSLLRREGLLGDKAA